MLVLAGIRWYADKDFPDGRLYGVRLEDIHIKQACEPQWLDKSPSHMARITRSLVSEAVWGWIAELACERRNTHFRIDVIATT